ncbi:MAG: shikimate dehydrogenase [Candidatus Omnitrophota bacterium]|nr:shikimate dehydrogenase [Candidatus Omnitrophota bacterium]
MKLYGLIGYPVKHSLSGIMHNSAFGALGIDAAYRLFEVAPDELRDFLLNPDKRILDIEGKSIRSRDLLGFNITIPHKVNAREILEERFPYPHQDKKVLQALYYVKLSGAINTVKRGAERLEYYNTDAPGFRRSLREDLGLDSRSGLKNKDVLVIGCGGAGRAIISALSWREVKINKIYVYDVNDSAVNSLRDHFSHLPFEWKKNLEEKVKFVSQEEIAEIVGKCRLLVNASPIGMEESDAPVIDSALLHDGLYVYDIVYNRKTRLIREAKARGLSAASGEGMLLYQGVDAFELWTGKSAPVEIMKEVLIKALNKAN